jgi:hypothetical protein
MRPRYFAAVLTFLARSFYLWRIWRRKSKSPTLLTHVEPVDPSSVSPYRWLVAIPLVRIFFFCHGTISSAEIFNYR